jgi:ABC-type Na+ transport system ATPase subunit NatA
LQYTNKEAVNVKDQELEQFKKEIKELQDERDNLFHSTQVVRNFQLIAVNIIIFKYTTQIEEGNNKVSELEQEITNLNYQVNQQDKEKKEVSV